MNNWVEHLYGVEISTAQRINDPRGSFGKFPYQNKFWHTDTYFAYSLNPKMGTFRGLHFQSEPYTETKIVTCIQGSIFDVIVDLRLNSKTYGKWTSIELNSENCKQVFIPKGLAHGILTLQPNTIVLYKLDQKYAENNSFSISPYCELEISWPINIDLISEKDSNGMSFNEASKVYNEI